MSTPIRTALWIQAVAITPSPSNSSRRMGCVALSAQSADSQRSALCGWSVSRDSVIETSEEAVEDTLAAYLALGCGVVSLQLEGGRNSAVVTKNVHNSQIDSKWQSISTGRAQ
jgi:hypothetical protein